MQSCQVNKGLLCCKQQDTPFEAFYKYYGNRLMGFSSQRARYPSRAHLLFRNSGWPLPSSARRTTTLWCSGTESMKARTTRYTCQGAVFLEPWICELMLCPWWTECLFMGSSFQFPRLLGSWYQRKYSSSAEDSWQDLTWNPESLGLTFLFQIPDKQLVLFCL